MSVKDQMLRESLNYGWPRTYPGNLEIDFREIANHPDGWRFGWALRELGTHMFTSVDEMQAINHIFGPHIHWYYWDGYQLIEMGIAELVELL